MLFKLFFAALVAIPFTAIEGLPFLGEIKHELAAHIFLVALGAAVFPVLAQFKMVSKDVREETYGLPLIMMLMFGVIGASFAINFPTIKDSFFQNRTGIEKFISSLILIFYGFGIAHLTYFISAKHAWDKLIVKPLSISVMICAVFSIFEMGAQVSGALAPAYGFLSSLVHGPVGELMWDTRLRSVAFEPPDFANTAGYIWPWLLGAALYAKGPQKAFLFGLWVVLNVMLFLSGARTSLVLITGLVTVFLTLKFLFLGKQDGRDPEKMILPITLVFALVFPSVLGFIGLYYDQMVYQVVADDNVSNLSRLASITAALRMFEANPVIGIGFGQFGFHVTEYMPAWGYYSWEIKHWLLDVTTAWPAVYSVYARFAADMGILGILMWLGIWLGLARAILIETLRYRKDTGVIPFAAMPLIMSCFCVLLAGVPNDSVRAPMIWINMGLACRYLMSMKMHRLKQTASEKETA